MASVNLCDRKGCKALVQGRALGVVALVVSSEPGAERLEREICPRCVGDVMSLLESAPTSEREPSYRDSYKRAADVPDDVAAATDEQLAAELLQRTMKRSGQRAIGNGPSIYIDGSDGDDDFA